MANTNTTSAMLVDELAALDPTRRQEPAAALRSVAETLAEVRDGKTASRVVGVLAHLLDPASGPPTRQREGAEALWRGQTRPVSAVYIVQTSVLGAPSTIEDSPASSPPRPAIAASYATRG